ASRSTGANSGARSFVGARSIVQWRRGLDTACGARPTVNGTLGHRMACVAAVFTTGALEQSDVYASGGNEVTLSARKLVPYRKATIRSRVRSKVSYLGETHTIWRYGLRRYALGVYNLARMAVRLKPVLGGRTFDYMEISLRPNGSLELRENLAYPVRDRDATI